MATTRGEKVNFLKQFHDERSMQLHKLSAVQFMDVWMHYDKDGKKKIIKIGIAWFGNIDDLYVDYLRL